MTTITLDPKAAEQIEQAAARFVDPYHFRPAIQTEREQVAELGNAVALIQALMAQADGRPVAAEKFAAQVSQESRAHNCDDHARPCKTNGPLGHGWECGECGAFLQAG
jgi:hypothetical protein